MTPSHPIFGVTFSSGYTAYWSAKSTDLSTDEARESALRRSRKWVKILGEIVGVVVRLPGPRLAGEV